MSDIVNLEGSGIMIITDKYSEEEKYWRTSS